MSKSTWISRSRPPTRSTSSTPCTPSILSSMSSAKTLRRLREKGPDRTRLMIGKSEKFFSATMGSSGKSSGRSDLAKSTLSRTFCRASSDVHVRAELDGDDRKAVVGNGGDVLHVGQTLELALQGHGHQGLHVLRSHALIGGGHEDIGDGDVRGVLAGQGKIAGEPGQDDEHRHHHHGGLAGQGGLVDDHRITTLTPSSTASWPPVMTWSPATRPLRIWMFSPAMTPSSTCLARTRPSSTT